MIQRSARLEAYIPAQLQERREQTHSKSHHTNRAMPEAYRPGLLSSLLLGGGGEDAASTTACAAPTKSTAAAAAVGGSDSLKQSKALASSPEKPKGGKKKKKKKDAEKGQGKSVAGDEEGGDDDTSGIEGGVRDGQKQGQQQGLASLFSTSNLKKFSRLERADKEEDAAEVCGLVCVWMGSLLRVCVVTTSTFCIHSTFPFDNESFAFKPYICMCRVGSWVETILVLVV